jgi:hypothetical protein
MLAEQFMIVYIQWLTSGYVYEHEKPLWWYTQSYDSVISIGGVWTLWAKDRLHCYGSSMYKVTVPGKYTIIWISIFIYNVHSYSVVHIIINSEKIYIYIYKYIYILGWVHLKYIYIFIDSVIIKYAYG